MKQICFGPVSVSRILDGDQEAMKKYGGVYLNEYSWAETRNAQLNSIVS